MKSLILRNATVYTMNPEQPRASAVATINGQIVAVGDDATMRPFIFKDTQVVDLEGRCLTPGLIDAHVHFYKYALGLMQIDVYEVPSLAEALARVNERVASAKPGQWLVGRGWKQDLWASRRFPNSADLDSVTPDNPVFLSDKSGHAGWANTHALSAAGIDKNSADPAGGQIQRDNAGNPTGILFESAMELIWPHIPEPSIDEAITALRQAQINCWEVGLVGLHDYDGRESLIALQTLHQQGDLGLRITKNIPAAHLEDAIGSGLRSGLGDAWLRIGGIKVFADGALGPRTALMVDPYEGEPDNTGVVVTDKEEMLAIASRASANGLSMTVHAIGDRAVHDILDVFEVVRGEEAGRGGLALSQPLRHRIEHVQVFHPSDRDRLAQLNVIASMQPVHATSDMEMADAYWGERAQYSYAPRTMLETGATVVFGSDCPVEPIDPLLGIYAAITRRRPNGDPGPDGWYPAQRLSAEETIYGFTQAAAYTSGQEATQGSVAVGKLADFTVFDRNLFSVSADELRELKVVGTVVDGDFKYRAF